MVTSPRRHENVDYVFAVSSHGEDELNTILNYLISIQPSIKFTIKRENDQRCLPFLYLVDTVT